MKYSEKMFFAHPLLRDGSADYQVGDFVVEIGDASVSEENVEFSVESRLSCTSLEKLIEEGGASAAFFITCMDTRFSQCIPLTVGIEKKYSIATGKLFGRVSILPVIHATRRIEAWESNDLHAEYGGHVDIPAAALLAVGDEAGFSIDRKRLKPLESIFDMAVDDSIEKGLFKVDTDNEKITILVHPGTKEDLEGMRNSDNGRTILLGSVYLPALMEVFSQIRQNGNDQERYSWFRVFKAKCDAHSIDPMNCSVLETSQTLLGIPLPKLQSVASQIL